MDALIYFDDPLPYGLDEIEDALDDALRGLGYVSGTGTGAAGSNIDISLADDGLPPPRAASLIRDALTPFALPLSSRLIIAGEQFPMH